VRIPDSLEFSNNCCLVFLLSKKLNFLKIIVTFLGEKLLTKEKSNVGDKFSFLFLFKEFKNTLSLLYVTKSGKNTRNQV